MQQGIKISNEIQKKIIKMYLDGEKNKSKIGKHFNICRGSVINMLKKANIPIIDENKEIRLWTQEEVNNFFNKNGCKLLSKFKRSDQKLDYICSCGRTSQVRFASFKKHPNCKKCGHAKIRHKKMDVFNFIQSHGHKITSTEYINARTPLELICPKGHKVKMTYSSIKQGHICEVCGHINMRGENHPQWNKNRTYEQRRKERKLFENTEWRNTVFIRDNYTCQKCKKRGGKLVAHHLNGYHWDIENRLSPDNGITLCKDCHKNFHSKYGIKNNTKEQYYEWNLSVTSDRISSDIT